jgi:membrane associated rhomboid family serine protease
MLRRLIDEFRDAPATMALCSLWVVVFALMVLNQAMHGSVITRHTFILGMHGGEPFGEMTLRNLLQGQVWLPLTSTFVHYGLLHLGLNLFMMYQLGGLIESWYGPWQFLAVSVVIGYVGNLLSALVRLALGSDPLVASGGGSTVVLGLAALCAVVGWRSRSRIGDYLRSQMVWLLVATAVLGQIVPNIDNWGHAGGALVGASIGFAHRILIRTVQRPLAKWAGYLCVALLVASLAAQARVAPIEIARREQLTRWNKRLVSAQNRLIAAEQACLSLDQIRSYYVLAGIRSDLEHAPFIPKSLLRRARPELEPGSKAQPEPGRNPTSLGFMPWETPDDTFHAPLKGHLARLDALKDDLGTGPTAEDYRQIHQLLENVPRLVPNLRKSQAFQNHMTALSRRAQQDRDAARVQFESLLKQARAAGLKVTEAEKEKKKVNDKVKKAKETRARGRSPSFAFA